jgi:membrane protein
VALIFLLYRFIPVRGIPTRAAFAERWSRRSCSSSRVAYAALTGVLSPTTIYTGTLYTIVSIVFWVYYAAIIFLLGGEVARVYEIRDANRGL